jgi:hypothetical protein
MACMRKLIVSKFLTLDGYYESVSKTFDPTPSAVPRSGARSQNSSASRRSTSSPTPSPRGIWHRDRTPPGIIRGADLYAEIAALRPRHPRRGRRRGQETEVGRDAGVDRRRPVVFRDLYFRLLAIAEHHQRRACAIADEEQLDASQAEDRIAAGDLDLSSSKVPGGPW